MINWTAVLITLIVCLTVLSIFAMSMASDKEEKKVEMDKDVVDLLERRSKK